MLDQQSSVLAMATIGFVGGDGSSQLFVQPGGGGSS